MVTAAFAQTADYHIRFGLRPERSISPEVIDMRWAHQYLDVNATEFNMMNRHSMDASNATHKGD
jgi:hypothetical protein